MEIKIDSNSNSQEHIPCRGFRFCEIGWEFQKRIPRTLKNKFVGISILTIILYTIFFLIITHCYHPVNIIIEPGAINETIIRGNQSSELIQTISIRNIGENELDTVTLNVEGINVIGINHQKAILSYGIKQLIKIESLFDINKSNIYMYNDANKFVDYVKKLNKSISKINNNITYINNAIGKSRNGTMEINNFSKYDDVININANISEMINRTQSINYLINLSNKNLTDINASFVRDHNIQSAIASIGRMNKSSINTTINESISELDKISQKINRSFSSVDNIVISLLPNNFSLKKDTNVYISMMMYISNLDVEGEYRGSIVVRRNGDKNEIKSIPLTVRIIDKD